MLVSTRSICFSRLSFFSADIAHELRTPITNLTTQTEVILSRKRTNENYTDILYSHLEEYERMSKMVSDMLLLAQTEHGLIKPNKDKVTANQEISDLIEYFEVLADEKNIKLTLSGPSIEIVCDKTMLRQALSNLISNAIKFSKPDSEVLISSVFNANYITIAIKDEGIGIPEADQKHLFTRFFRAHNVENIKGTGLGLNIVKHHVELLGGTISFQSELGVGTVFIVELPLDTI